MTGVTLGARTPSTDPLFDATDATNGGGDTGSVLISPYHPAGHRQHPLLQPLQLAAHDGGPVQRGLAAPGLDGHGHIGYAAQPGLAPFGRDVFTNPPVRGTSTGMATATARHR